MTDVRRPLFPLNVTRANQPSRSTSPTTPTRTVGRAQAVKAPPAEAARMIGRALAKADEKSTFTAASSLVARSAPTKKIEQPAAQSQNSIPSPSVRTKPFVSAPPLHDVHFELEMDARVLDKAHRADRRELSRAKDAQRSALRESYRDYDDEDGEENFSRRRR